MKRRGLLSLLLALALLAGCSPGAEGPGPDALPTAAPSPVPEATPTPEPTPEPAAEPEPVDFYAFLDGVNAARKAITTQAGPIELPAEYTPDFYEQNDTFTEAEMELLTTAHDPEENLTREDLVADAETFFTLLQTTYGAYWYFGGDDTFLPLLDAVKEDLAAAKAPTVSDLENILYRHLSPVLVDGHFQLGKYAMRTTHALYMYYVPGLYLDSPDGVEDPDYIKPTIGPDGRICWWYAALSHDGRDLPVALDGNSLKWMPATSNNYPDDPAFSESQWRGVPVLTSRRMSARGENADAEKQALQRLSDCGGEYADSPLLIFDVRGNTGGSDQYIMGWFQGWAGVSNPNRITVFHRYSQLSCRVFGDGYYPAEHMGTWGGFHLEGTWTEHAGPTLVLQNNSVASSGETAVKFFRSAADTLFVGGPTLGCSLVPNNISFYLPHSGLSCYFGSGLSFSETDENRDGVGFLPDLWVVPSMAMVSVKKLVEYYGLAEEG